MKPSWLILALSILFAICVATAAHWDDPVKTFQFLVAIGFCVTVAIATVLALNDTPKRGQ
jgi:hypothetical protein